MKPFRGKNVTRLFMVASDDEERQSIITVVMTMTIYLDPQMAHDTL